MSQAHRHPTPRRRASPRLAVALAIVAASCGPGCTSSGGFLSAWRMGRDSSLSKGPTDKELGDDRSLMAKWLTPKAAPNTRPDDAAPSSLVLGSDGWKPMKPVPNPEAEAEFAAAEALFQQGKHEEAEAAFTKVAK